MFENLSVLGKLLTGALSGKQGSVGLRQITVGGNSFDYQIYLPADIETKKNLPLIVFLHGIGQRGAGGFLPTDSTYGTLIRQQLAQIPAIILLPQCRPASYWSDPVMDEMVMSEIGENVKNYQADERRISLIGVSMGGYGVWHFAAAYPKKFAAFVSICGGSSMTEGDRFNPLAEKVGETPAWLFHGADDKIVQVSESRQIVKALENHGANVKYSEYPNVGHNVWLNAFAEKNLIPWVLEQQLVR